MADSSVTLVGNLTKDPELRYTNNQKPFVSFSIAVNRKWDGGEQTSYFDCVSWGDIAVNITNSFHKGNRVVVVGRLEQRTWEGKEGDKRSKVECVATDVAASVRWGTVDFRDTPRNSKDDVFKQIVAAGTAAQAEDDYF